MELRHLRYFVTVADEANFSRAAVLLRVSQPAISRQIKTLEGEVGAPLFLRGRNSLRLTKAGTTLLGHARELLRQSTQALLDVRSVSGTSDQAIHLGYLVTAQASFLSSALRAFQTRHPTIRVSVYEMNPAAQVTALRAGQLDLALIGHHHASTLSGLKISVLKTIPLQAIVSDQHPLTQRKRVAVSELSNETFIGYIEEAFPGRNDLITRVCMEAGFKPRLRACAETLSAVLAMVGAGEGVCLIPADVAKLSHPGVKFLSLRQPVPTIRYAAISHRKSGSAALSDLLGCLQIAARGARESPPAATRSS